MTPTLVLLDPWNDLGYCHFTHGFSHYESWNRIPQQLLDNACTLEIRRWHRIEKDIIHRNFYLGISMEPIYSQRNKGYAEGYNNLPISSYWPKL